MVFGVEGDQVHAAVVEGVVVAMVYVLIGPGLEELPVHKDYSAGPEIAGLAGCVPVGVRSPERPAIGREEGIVLRIHYRVMTPAEWNKS